MVNELLSFPFIPPSLLTLSIPPPILPSTLSLHRLHAPHFKLQPANSLLDWALYERYLHEAVIYTPQQQEQCNQKCSNVYNVHPSFLIRNMVGATCDPDPDTEDDKPEHEEDDGPRPGKLGAYTRHLPAVWTPCERIIEGVEQESVDTVRTRYAAHSWNVWSRDWNSSARCKVNYSLAVRPGACYPLRAALTDEKTVAGTSDVLPARRGVSDGRCLVTLAALHHMLILLSRDIDHILTNPAGNHRHSIGE